MKYQTRHNPFIQAEANHLIEEFSFVKNHLIKQKEPSSKLECKQYSGQLSSSDQTRSSQKKLRQSLGLGKSRKGEKRMFESRKALREPQNEEIQNMQECQHLYKRQSINRSNYPKSEVISLDQLQQTGDQIYKEIIRVLQIENRNLKEQNQYFIHQHQRMLTQNSQLRAQIGEIKQINLLHLEIQKLQDINRAYQNQLQELKYILYEEVVTIHQKLNLYISEYQTSLIYNQLDDSFKIPASKINLDRLNFTIKNQRKEERQQSSVNTSGMMLSQMLQLDGNDNFEKSPEKTAESIDKENMLDYLNLDFKFIQSPTQTTFSGHLRSSN